MKIKILKEQIPGMPRYGISGTPLELLDDPGDLDGPGHPPEMKYPGRADDPVARARAKELMAKEKAEKERKIKIAKEKEVADKKKANLAEKLKYVRSIQANDENRFKRLVKAIPPGSMKDQPRVSRIPPRERKLGGSKMIPMGASEVGVDSVLAWAVENLRIHAEIMGIIPAKSRTYLPLGPNSGYRTSDMQFDLFKRRFDRFDAALQTKGLITNTYGKAKRSIQAISGGKYVYKDTRVLPKGIILGGKRKNLAWAIARLTGINVARPQDAFIIKAHDGSATKVKGFPNHQTGRAIDMNFGFGTSRANNSRITATSAWKLLDKYHDMYGLAKYTRDGKLVEAWHWELNKANWQFLKMLQNAKISPIEYAIATTIEMPPVVKPAV